MQLSTVSSPSLAILNLPKSLLTQGQLTAKVNFLAVDKTCKAI